MRKAETNQSRSRTLIYDDVTVSRSHGESTDVSEDTEDVDERYENLISVGLHFCRRYKNLVKYNPEFCARCPFNGLNDNSVTTPRS